jgi:hypothetical protein
MFVHQSSCCVLLLLLLYARICCLQLHVQLFASGQYVNFTDVPEAVKEALNLSDEQ